MFYKILTLWLIASQIVIAEMLMSFILIFCRVIA